MNFNWLPAVLLLVLLVFSGPKNPISAITDNRGINNTEDFADEIVTANLRNAVKTTVPKTSLTSSNKAKSSSFDEEDDEIDYKIIYNYIRSNYRKVADEDADLIASSLVDNSRKRNLDPKLAAALMEKESSFNKRAVSHSGAKGLGQLMDIHFERMNVKDPYDIEDNVKVMTNHFSYLIEVWQERSRKLELAIASYYRGLGSIKRRDGDLDFMTERYVKGVMDSYEKLKDCHQKYARKD
ncbi:MAG: lytic transglycosylase domain-containing protein [Candidatus Margulisiibacteriota bacterium]|jgi:soluble lytic murein transglycosylase-like protein